MFKIKISVIPDISENILEEKFFAGETLKGEVILHAGHDAKARRISINFIGLEEASVIRGTPKARRTYHEFIEHFNREIIIKEAEGENLVDLEGDYKFNYLFDVPEEIPGTLQISTSSIQYYLDIKIDIPNRKDAHRIVGFFILPHATGRDEQRSLTEILPSDGSTPECKLIINGETFYWDETIEMNVNLSMIKGQKFKEVKLSIQEISSKTARGHTDTYIKILEGWKINKKDLKTGQNGFNFNFTISNLDYYSIVGKLLKREYFVHLIMTKNFKSDKQIRMPITILPSIKEKNEIV